MPKQDLPSDAGDKYVQLIDNVSELHIEVQSVEHPSRVHLDIETDDVEAEVERLKKLGAKVVGHINTWCVMEAPTGKRFCVVQQDLQILSRRLTHGNRQQYSVLFFKPRIISNRYDCESHLHHNAT